MMKLEKREMLKSGRRDVYIIPGSANRLVRSSKGAYIRSATGVRISQIYEKIYDFKGGLAVFDKGKMRGIVRETGEEVFDNLFQNANLDGKVIRICQNGKWGFADYDGNIICAPEYNCVERFVNGYARFSTSDGKWGIIDVTGNVVVPANYEYLGELTQKCVIAKKAIGFGAIDLKGNTVVPFRYEKIGYEKNGDEDKNTVIYNSAQDKFVQ